VLSLLLLPKGIPAGAAAVGQLGGVAGGGAVSGCLVALQAMGMVLVLRSTRIINFSQIQLGALTGLIFYQLVHHSQLVLFSYSVCHGCFHGLPNDISYLQSHPSLFTGLLVQQGYTGWLAANFWVSLVLSLLIAPLLSWLIYVAIIRRFERAPRLIITVVTLALAQLLTGAAAAIPSVIFQQGANDSASFAAPIGDVKFSVGPHLFHTGDIIVAGVAVLAAVLLTLFFRVSRTGIALRGVADNPSRARTLGMSVSSLSSISWLLAGVLSGVAAILGVIQTGDSGVSPGAAFQVGPLVVVLAAVVVARLSSLPIAVAAAVALGVIESVFFWNFSTSVAFDGALLLTIAGVLLAQAPRQSRADREASAAYLAAREARPVPREMRRMPMVDTRKRWLGLGLATLALGYPFAVSPGQVSLGVLILIYAIVGLGLLVLTGWAGQISLGHFAFAAVGGYVATMLAGHGGVPIILTLPLGGLAGAVVAVGIGIPALRLRGLHLAVMTLAFALATSSVLLDASGLGHFLPARIDRPVLLGFDLNDERAFFYVCLVFLALSFLLVAALRRSRTGRALIACRDNEAAAQSFGISLLRIRLQAFAVSGFLAAFAGALLAYEARAMDPTSFAPEQSVAVFNTVVIGGMGSVIGPLLGSAYNALFVLLNVPFVVALSGGLGVVIVLMLAPGGLSGIVYTVRDAWLRRVATRHRMSVPSLGVDFGHGATRVRSAITPKFHASGSAAYVPVRYRLARQWEKFTEPEAASHG
jgi:branched-chain amino acid transport system permease protein